MKGKILFSIGLIFVLFMSLIFVSSTEADYNHYGKVDPTDIIDNVTCQIDEATDHMANNH